MQKQMDPIRAVTMITAEFIEFKNFMIAENRIINYFLTLLNIHMNLMANKANVFNHRF